jgi:S-adenosylmethionine decarboxylase
MGRHIIAELSGCRADYLEDMQRMREVMVRAAIAAKAEVREVAIHKFSPQGVSGVVVIAESHISMHTWPEAGYVALDIYTCGDKTLPEKACEYVAECLEAREVFQTEVTRGIPGKGDRFRHSVSTRQIQREAMVAGLT